MNKKENRHQIFHRKKKQFIQAQWLLCANTLISSIQSMVLIISWKQRCNFMLFSSRERRRLSNSKSCSHSCRIRSFLKKKKAQESYCQTKHYHRNISIWYLIWCTLLFYVFYAYYADGSETNGQTSNLTTCNPKLMKFLNWTLSGNTLVEMYM